MVFVAVDGTIFLLPRLGSVAILSTSLKSSYGRVKGECNGNYTYLYCCRFVTRKSSNGFSASANLFYSLKVEPSGVQFRLDSAP